MTKTDRAAPPQPACAASRRHPARQRTKSPLSGHARLPPVLQPLMSPPNFLQEHLQTPPPLPWLTRVDFGQDEEESRGRARFSCGWRLACEARSAVPRNVTHPRPSLASVHASGCVQPRLNSAFSNSTATFPSLFRVVYTLAR